MLRTAEETSTLDDTARHPTPITLIGQAGEVDPPIAKQYPVIQITKHELTVLLCGVNA